MIEFTVIGQPVPFKRAGRNGNRSFTPPDMAKWESMVQGEAVELEVTPLTGDLAMHLKFRRKDKRRADLDNLCKCVADALNGIAYKDDAQVVELVASVEYGSNAPGVDVLVKGVGE